MLGLVNIGHAQVYWGGVDSDWSTTTNWVGGALPNSSQYAYLPAEPSDASITLTLSADQSVRGLQFLTSSDGYTITGADSTLHTLTIDDGGIYNGTSATQSIISDTNSALALTLSANQTWNANIGGIAISTDVDLGANTLYLRNGDDSAITVSGDISGTGGVQLTNSGANGGTFSTTLSGNNSYSGNTVVNGNNVLTVGHDNAVGTGNLLIYNASTLKSATSVTLANAATLYGNFTISGTNDLTLSGNINLNNGSRTVTVSNTGQTRFGGVVSNGGLYKAGSGTLSLGGLNTYTGITQVSGGTLNLDFADQTDDSSNIISSSSLLQLQGSTLQISGKSSGTSTQSFNNTQITSGASTVNVISNGGTATNLNLGNLSRSAPGTVDFTPPAAGSITTTTNDTNGIIGGWATIDYADWASANGSDQIVAATYTDDTWGSANNTNVTMSDTIATASTTNSLRFGSTGAQTLTLDGTNIISSGGIMVTAGVGDNASTITGGSLRPAANELFIINSNPDGHLAIDSTLTNGSGTTTLNLNGPGAVTLNAANTFTGQTYINGGTLNLGHSTNTLPTSNIFINNGTLNLGANSDQVGHVYLNSGAITGSGTLTASSFQIQEGSITADTTGGNIVKLSDGTFTHSGSFTNSNTLFAYNGVTNLNGTNYSGSQAYVGDGATDTATLNLNGSMTLSSDFYAGRFGSATVNIPAGVTLQNYRGYIGYYTPSSSSSTGSAIINVAGQWTNTGSLSLGYYGDVTLNLTNGGKVSASNTVILGYRSGSTSSINITGTTAPGILDVAGISGGGNGGNATLNLNHSKSDYHLTSDGSDSGTGVNISGNTLINHLGSGTTIMPGAVTSYGAITISDGTLQIGVEGSNGSVTGPIVNNSELILNQSSDYTRSNPISGSGNLTYNGTGALTFSGSNSYTGTTTINAGSLQFRTPASLYNDTPASWTADNLAIASGAAAIFHVGGSGFDSSEIDILATLGTATGGFKSGSSFGLDTTYAGGTFTYASVIADPDSDGDLTTNTRHFIKSGNNNLILTAANTYSGTTTIAAGNLQLGLGGTTGSITTGDIINNGNLLLNRSDSLALTNDISGPGGLYQNGTGTTTLSGNNTYTGSTIINSGTLAIDSESALGDNPSNNNNGQLYINGGTLQTTASFDLDDSNRGIYLANSGGTFSPDTGTTLNIKNIMGGNGALTLTGGGTLILSANNSHYGPITISDGILQVGSGGDTGYAQGSIVNNAELVIDRSVGLTRSAPISGTGNFSHNGTGTFTLSGNNSYTGTTTINAGTLQFQNYYSLYSGNSAHWTTDNLVVNSGATAAFTVGSGSNFNASHLDTIAALGTATGGFKSGSTIGLDLNGSFTYASVLADPDSDGDLTTNVRNLEKLGNGSLYLTGDNTFSGTTTISAGTLQLGLGGTTGSLASGDIINNGTLIFNRSDSNTVANTISGTGQIYQSGSGTTTLSGNNSHTGLTQINGGTLSIASENNLGANPLSPNSAHLRIQGGDLRTTASFDIDDANRGVYVTGASSINPDAGTTLDIKNVVIGSNLIMNGEGTLILSGANTYNGTNTLSAGTLVVNHDNALSSGTLNFNGGTLSSSAPRTFNQSVMVNADSGIAGSNAVTLGGSINLNGATRDLNVTNSADTTFTGTISNGALTKSGSGTLNLNGTNSYTGDTTVTAGILAIGASSSLVNDSEVTINGGSLQLNNTAGQSLSSLNGSSGTLSSAGSITLNQADATTSSFAGAISGNDTRIIKSGLGTLELTGTSSYGGDTDLNTGTLVVGGTSALGTGGTLQLNGGNLQAAPGGGAFANPVSLNAATTIDGSNALTLSGAATLNGFNTLTTSNSAPTTISGNIGESSPSILIKQGSGELQLTGANTYTGGTFVQAGTVRINNSSGSAFGTGAVTIASGATLTGSGTSSSALQINGIFAPGNSPGLATVGSGTVLNGTLEIELGGTLRADSVTFGSGTYDAINVSGSESITLGGILNVVAYEGFAPTAGDSFQIFDASSIGGTFSAINFSGFDSALNWNTANLISDGLLTVSAVPEPSTAAALLGFFGLALAATRRRLAR